MQTNFPFLNNKYDDILFEHDSFQIAYGKDEKENYIIAFRYDKNFNNDKIAETFNHNCVGYPYRYCNICNNSNYNVIEPTRLWVKIPNFVSMEFLDILPKLKKYGGNIDDDAIQDCRDKINKNEKEKNIDGIKNLSKETENIENELFMDKFMVIFENDYLQIATGINKFDKELVIAFRWLINISETKQDKKGYPYQWCKNQKCPNNKKLVKVWLPLPNYLALDFIDILSKKFENKADFKIKSVVENS